MKLDFFRFLDQFWPKFWPKLAKFSRAFGARKRQYETNVARTTDNPRDPPLLPFVQTLAVPLIEGCAIRPCPLKTTLGAAQRRKFWDIDFRIIDFLLETAYLRARKSFFASAARHITTTASFPRSRLRRPRPASLPGSARLRHAPCLPPRCRAPSARQALLLPGASDASPPRSGACGASPLSPRSCLGCLGKKKTLGKLDVK